LPTRRFRLSVYIRETCRAEALGEP
jgi:hypothetical protein